MNRNCCFTNLSTFHGLAEFHRNSAAPLGSGTVPRGTTKRSSLSCRKFHTLKRKTFATPIRVPRGTEVVVISVCLVTLKFLHVRHRSISGCSTWNKRTDERNADGRYMRRDADLAQPRKSRQRVPRGTLGSGKRHLISNGLFSRAFHRPPSCST